MFGEHGRLRVCDGRFTGGWRKAPEHSEVFQKNPFLWVSAGLFAQMALIGWAGFVLAGTVLFVAGLAYTSFANLGILTRQRVQVFPFVLVLDHLKATFNLGKIIRTELPTFL